MDTPRNHEIIRHHLPVLSLLNTINFLEGLNVYRRRTAVHNRVQKADVQPAGGEISDRIAAGQKSILVNDEEHWLYAAVDPETDRIIHAGGFSRYSIPIRREFLTELCEKHGVGDAVFLVDDAAASRVRSVEKGMSIASRSTAIEIKLEVSFEKYNKVHLRSQTVSVMPIR